MSGLGRLRRGAGGEVTQHVGCASPGDAQPGMSQACGSLSESCVNRGRWDASPLLSDGLIGFQFVSELVAALDGDSRAGWTLVQVSCHLPQVCVLPHAAWFHSDAIS